MTGAGLTEEKLFGDVLASATMGEASVAQEKTTNRRPKEGLKIWCQSRAVNTTLQAPVAQKSIHMSLVLWILIWVFILFILFHTISRHITLSIFIPHFQEQTLLHCVASIGGTHLSSKREHGSNIDEWDWGKQDHRGARVCFLLPCNA